VLTKVTIKEEILSRYKTLWGGKAISKLQNAIMNPKQ
jgi:hypothetical protein